MSKTIATASVQRREWLDEVEATIAGFARDSIN